MIKKLEIKKNILMIPGLVFVFVLIGFLLRIIGIWYGFPLFINVDEPALVSTVLSLKSNLNPGHFDWPHLYYYLNVPFYAIGGLFKDVLKDIFNIKSVYLEESYFFIISRLVTVVFGTLTIITVYLLTKIIFGKKTAIISALIITILPVHVFESHYAKTDVAQTFFTSLSLIYIFKIFYENKKKDYILAGVLIGLTTSIKYGGVLMFFPLFLAFALSSLNYKKWLTKKNIINLLYSGIAAVAAFYLTTPFALLDFRKFFSTERAVGAVWQIQNVGSLSWVEYPISLYETFFKMYKVDMGLGIWFFFVSLLFLFLFFNKRKKEYTILLLPTLLFSLYISHFERSPSHYFLFLAPFYVPAIAFFIFESYEWIIKTVKDLKSIKLMSILENKYVYWLIILVLLAPSIYLTLKSDFLMSKKDTRTIAYNWIQSNLNDDDFLVVVGEDLESYTFKKSNTELVKRFDTTTVDYDAPFYVIIGVDDITKDSLTTGDKDPQELKGNSSELLKDSNLLFEAQNKLRNGPPVYIFRVNTYNR